MTNSIAFAGLYAYAQPPRHDIGGEGRRQRPDPEQLAAVRVEAVRYRRSAASTDDLSPHSAADSPPSAPRARTRRFELIRHVDVSGVSGTGPVAEGIEFSGGAVALRWTSTKPCTAVWDSIDDLLSVHGHDGATEVRWIDQAVASDDRECVGAGIANCPA